jgi:hypothetical protein
MSLSMTVARPWCLVLSLAGCAFAEQSTAVRIGCVDIRDYSGRAEDASALNRQLNERLRAAGYETVELKRQAPDVVEETARQAGAQYVLYTEVIHVQPHRSTAQAEVEIEFRLYGLDETFPRVSTMISARGNAQNAPLVEQTRLDTREVGFAFIPIERKSADPVAGPEEGAAASGRAIRLAFDAVFSKQAALVGAGVRRGPRP